MLLLSAALLWISLPTAALGQDFAEVSEAQRELNDRAFQFVVDEEYETAIDLLNSSLAIQELNITYLNLGRALTKAGRCDEAIVAFDKVLTSPKVLDPDPEAVLGILAKYKEELGVVCSGTVALECHPETMQIRIDDGGPQLCQGQLELPPGDYKITAESNIGLIAVNVHVVGTEHQNLYLSTEVATTIDEPDTGANPVEVAGWAVAGAGLATLATALVIELAILKPGIDDLEDAAAGYQTDEVAILKDTLDTTQTLNLALYSTGGALVLVGASLVTISMLFLDEDDDYSDEASAYAAPIMLGDGGLGFGIGGTW